MRLLDAFRLVDGSFELSVARHIFHGQRGELRRRYRQGQEDQLGAPGLVVIDTRDVKERTASWFIKQSITIEIIP